MQPISQPPFSALALNEFFQNFKFLRATGFNATRVMENVTLMIGEHKFVIDTVLASLASCLKATEENYYGH